MDSLPSASFSKTNRKMMDNMANHATRVRRHIERQGLDTIRCPVEAARDLIELPLKHADIFLGIGAKPIGHGIILAGPPCTGKTLLARAIDSQSHPQLGRVFTPF